MCHFQMRKMRLFQIQNHFKYKNVSLSNTKNASFLNKRMCHSQKQEKYRS